VLLLGSESSIAAAKTDESREHLEILGDYVDVLLGTGTRPGIELLSSQWKQIKTSAKPTVFGIGEMTDGLDDIFAQASHGCPREPRAENAQSRSPCI
jgi:hypothetical protein